MAITSASHTPTLSFNALFESKNPAFPRIHMKRRLVISSIKIKTFYSKCYGKIKVGISKLGIDIGIRYFSSINIDNFSIVKLKISELLYHLQADFQGGRKQRGGGGTLGNRNFFVEVELRGLTKMVGGWRGGRYFSIIPSQI